MEEEEERKKIERCGWPHFYCSNAMRYCNGLLPRKDTGFFTVILKMSNIIIGRYDKKSTIITDIGPLYTDKDLFPFASLFVSLNYMP